jgi:hypothetical protein
LKWSRLCRPKWKKKREKKRLRSKGCCRKRWGRNSDLEEILMWDQLKLSIRQVILVFLKAECQLLQS